MKGREVFHICENPDCDKKIPFINGNINGHGVIDAVNSIKIFMDPSQTADHYTVQEIAGCYCSINCLIKHLLDVADSLGLPISVC